MPVDLLASLRLGMRRSNLLDRDLPIIELAGSSPLLWIAQRLTCSTEASELVGTVDEILRLK
jgi:hypothetical protein